MLQFLPPFSRASLLFLALLAVACQAEPEVKTPAPTATTPAKSAQVAPTPAAPAKTQATLVFFMNPGGRPCQIQKQILEESRAQWGEGVQLKYVSTDVPADRDLFYRYGIRSLPNLILLGPDGAESLRFPPGIQNAEAIVAGIRSRVKLEP